MFLVLVAGLAASVAIAAPDKITSPFVDSDIQLGVVEGTATLDPTPQGEVMVHAKLTGLEPGVTYELVLWTEAIACGFGETLEVITFEANPAGIANLNRKVAEDINLIGSVSVRVVGAEFPSACADF